jgi:hypothetical protein
MKATDPYRPAGASARRTLTLLARFLAVVAVLLSVLGIIQTMVLAGHLNVGVQTASCFINIGVYSGEDFTISIDITTKREQNRPSHPWWDYGVTPDRRVRGCWWNPAILPRARVYYEPVVDPMTRAVHVKIPYATVLAGSATTIWLLRRAKTLHATRGFPIALSEPQSGTEVEGNNEH